MITMNAIALAINSLLTNAFPADTVHVNLLPKDFERPSFLIELVDIERTQVNRSTIAVAAVFSVTCYIEVDGHYNADVDELAERQRKVMDLFLDGFLAVDDRCLEVQAAQGGVDFTESYIDLSFDYFDDRPVPGDAQPPMETVITNLSQEV